MSDLEEPSPHRSQAMPPAPRVIPVPGIFWHPQNGAQPRGLKPPSPPRGSLPVCVRNDPPGSTSKGPSAPGPGSGGPALPGQRGARCFRPAGAARRDDAIAARLPSRSLPAATVDPGRNRSAAPPHMRIAALARRPGPAIRPGPGRLGSAWSHGQDGECGAIPGTAAGGRRRRAGPHLTSPHCGGRFRPERLLRVRQRSVTGPAGPGSPR